MKLKKKSIDPLLKSVVRYRSKTIVYYEFWNISDSLAGNTHPVKHIPFNADSRLAKNYSVKKTMKSNNTSLTYDNVHV